ncbi:serine/arginine repetitive matrix protein 2-like isoform X2 [Palaemon carinicauda]
MTSRTRKNKKNSKEDPELKMPRKQDTASAAAASPETPQKGRRRPRQSKASPGTTPESPPRKTRRGTATPESPQRASPRSRSSTQSSKTPPTLVNLSPRGRGRRSRRGSTDSSASSIGNTSGTSTSTPTTRRTRRGSNSSEASCISENTTASATSSRGGRKRPKSYSPPTAPATKTNGASPPLSPKRSAKRRRGAVANDVTPTNGRSGRRTRGRGPTSETPPPGDLDGGTEVADDKPIDGDSDKPVDHVTSDINGDKIHTTSDIKLEVVKDVEDGQDHLCQNSSEVEGNAQNEGRLRNRNEKGKQRRAKKDSEDRRKVPVVDGDDNIEIQDKTKLCNSNEGSSHNDSAMKRRLSDSENSCPETPESKITQKKVRTEELPIVGVKGSKAVVLDKMPSQGSTNNDKPNVKDYVNIVPIEVDKDNLSVADTFLDTLSLNDEQKNEIACSIPSAVKDSSVNEIVETLVEQLLNGTTNVKTMNAPRFNKFLRQLLTHYCSLETTKQSKHTLCEKAVEWARERKSVNLRHELELTLMSLYYATKHYKKAETIANALYSETKKLQDKEKTVKACLCLSQVYHAMGNISKARASITTAKTEALKIYTPPDMQGELDLQSGIMQVAEGKDMETAFSYFKEAATGFTSRRQRSQALKYMLLTKVMVNRSEEGEKAVRSQSHVQDIDEGVEAMLAITSAANKSSLADFK